eukprot:CAMPEP_0202868508 /NCGR_PEP_ID=MMETSP1391-20130828/10920_1 /ASSEMBLY_ACC=CAM_ASM_000867 /TAXON_ID=1034604 /ORGANISM="Chlamydomonas leiostraca, Strain SAG 11-49" /LENGTH=49 /DNA_ID= /DNA_START= /DNA_END= /DNA_ORIENTATION=
MGALGSRPADGVARVEQGLAGSGAGGPSTTREVEMKEVKRRIERLAAEL